MFIPACFSFTFAWNISFHHFTFGLCVCLFMRYDSYKQHIDGICFLIHTASLCFKLENLVYLCSWLLLLSSDLALPFFPKYSYCCFGSIFTFQKLFILSPLPLIFLIPVFSHLCLQDSLSLSPSLMCVCVYACV